MATNPSYCDQCGARLSGGVRFCEACGAAVMGATKAESLTTATVPEPPARKPETVPKTPAPKISRTAAHRLFWAAPIALCIAAVAGWLLLQGPQPALAPDSPAAPSAQPASTPAAQIVAEQPEAEPTAGAIEGADRFPAESPDSASPAADPVAAEHQAAKARFERAYRAYTVLITEGGSGSVIEARDEYAAAYEDLKRIEAAHPEYAR
jgi:hypothetical protein